MAPHGRTLVNIQATIFGVLMAATPGLAAGYNRCHGDTNKMLQLILADEVIRGDVLDVTEDGAEPWGQFRVMIESELGPREAFLTPISQVEPQSLLGTERMVFIRRLVFYGEPKHFVISEPSIGIYPIDKGLLRESPALRQCIKEAAERFARRSGRCPDDFQKNLAMLDTEKQQEAFDWIFSQRPFTAAQFVCLADSIVSQSRLAWPQLSLPYAVWEGSWVHGFSNRGQLIAALLPNLVDFSLYNEAAEQADFEKLRTAWLYWGSVEAYSAEARESSGTPNPGTPR
jgi:hypothetical protein